MERSLFNGLGFSVIYGVFECGVMQVAWDIPIGF